MIVHSFSTIISPDHQDSSTTIVPHNRCFTVLTVQFPSQLGHLLSLLSKSGKASLTVSITRIILCIPIVTVSIRVTS